MVSIARRDDFADAITTPASWRSNVRALTLADVPKTPVSEEERIYRRRLGVTIIDLRATKGVSQATLAAEIERSEAALSRWETGKATPSAFDLVRIAEFFELSVEEVDLLIYPPEVSRSPIAERMATRPHPSPVPTPGEQALTEIVVRSGVEEGVRRDRSRNGAARRTPQPSTRQRARAK